MKAFDEFLTKYYPEANRIDSIVMYGYTVAQGLVHVLKACGDNLTRENIMKQAASIKDLEIGSLLPGIKVNTSATDFAPISAVQLHRFKGEAWDRFGEVIDAESRRLKFAKSDRPIASQHRPPRTSRGGFLLQRLDG